MTRRLSHPGVRVNRQFDADVARPAAPFVGGFLVLDFLNTELPWNGEYVELLQTTDDAAVWLQSAFTKYGEEMQHARKASISRPVLHDLREWRTQLRVAFDNRVTQPERLQETLNAVLRAAHPHIDIAQGKLLLTHRASGAFNIIASTIALSAVDLIQRDALHRVHECTSDECELLFFDATKSATRRWCSIACFDRFRARRRRAPS